MVLRKRVRQVVFCRADADYALRRRRVESQERRRRVAFGAAVEHDAVEMPFSLA